MSRPAACCRARVVCQSVCQEWMQVNQQPGAKWRLALVRQRGSRCVNDEAERPRLWDEPPSERLGWPRGTRSPECEVV